MTNDASTVLRALYDIEHRQYRAHEPPTWATVEEVAAQVDVDHPHHGDQPWVREQLRALWIGRKVMQIPLSQGAYDLRDVVLSGRDAHGLTESRLETETNDCRGYDGHPWERVACYSEDVSVGYRSRVAEVRRLLALNYARFQMAPSTGLLKYERRPQFRPEYSVSISAFADALCQEIADGRLTVETATGVREPYPLRTSVDRELLSRAIAAVLGALADLFRGRGQPEALAPFQERSVRALLCGLYTTDYRKQYDAQVVTAGVGSGKSYAFQIGALMHVAYQALRGQRRVQVMLLYPRVVLAANQFQDLFELVAGVATRLAVPLNRPILDAGGQLAATSGGGEGQQPSRGQLYEAILRAYQTDHQIVISNLDTLANRLVHPEASRGLLENLDVIVVDEVHLLSGLYGAHAKMLLARVAQLRALWRLRTEQPDLSFGALLQRRSTVSKAYVVAASATISEPSRHVGRVLGIEARRVFHVDVTAPIERGWVHHIFLRQRPEASSMTAATNAVSCLVHNRRDGLHLEYYQGETTEASVGLETLRNPVTATSGVGPREPRLIHKTIGFSDSLDGVGRWADLIADNEQTKAAAMGASANPAGGALPYFSRFQEPLWRVVHHMSFAAEPPSWQRTIWDHYGTLCRDCKRGIRRCADRIPSGLRTAQRAAVERLWDFRPENGDSYLARLGVGADHTGAAHLDPLRAAAGEEVIGNLDACGFFQSGLCWWWSRDHLGSNHPQPATGADTLNGFKKPANGSVDRYHPVNGLRVRSFTSKDEFRGVETSINNLFRVGTGTLFRDRSLGAPTDEANCAMVIGSPKIEVGVDLARVTDGITFRAMRDPASLQQKVGRVGREGGADSMIVHVVTENARDHYYFRNPRIALDPDYLQPIPLHENNRVVARNHYFMAIIDFLSLQGSGPVDGRIAGGGERLFLINDHRIAGRPPLAGWDQKVRGAFDFLFGTHSRRGENAANVREYLRQLGARDADISNPDEAEQLTPSHAPTSRAIGALDVFQHEFGPNFLLTPIRMGTQTATLAQVCATTYPFAPNPHELSELPRHQEFLRVLPREDVLKHRSYLYQILTLPVFRRGVPLRRIPGDQPYLWTPNLFEAVGNEYVRIIEERSGRTYEHGYESLSLALALLTPGTVSYRYTSQQNPGPSKVPVSRHGSTGLATVTAGIYSVKLDVVDAQYFEPAPNCPDLGFVDLPKDFPWMGTSVQVFAPRQIGLVSSASEPLVTIKGLLVDGDSAPWDASNKISVPTPPRCFPVRWYRLAMNAPSPTPDRLQGRFRRPDGEMIPSQARPPVLGIFAAIEYDSKLEVTDFVWGLDRQFMSRAIEPARLVYSAAGLEGGQSTPIALGRHYETAGLRFEVDLSDGTPLDRFFNDLWRHPESGAHQAILHRLLYAFLTDHARNLPDPGAPDWVEPSRASVFAVRNLRTVVTFHLLERWHPTESAAAPTNSPCWSLEALVGCFTPGHEAFLSDERFSEICRWVAAVQNPASVEDRESTLLSTLQNLQMARARVGNLNDAYARQVAEELLLNTLGISLQAAALRLTGAETSDLSYFYSRGEQGTSAVYLFDTDDFGNGTADLVRDTLHVSAVERLLVARQRALDGVPDPLPTTDFADSLEDILQECDASHAAHLAYHDVSSGITSFEELEDAKVGERLVAGAVMDFIRNSLGVSSIDHVLAFQTCPEFLAHCSTYASNGEAALVPSPAYPTFQALESAMGFCVDGCVACVVAPEQNLRGVLTARETVSKLLLDAAYRVLVCEDDNELSRVSYPGSGPGRTERWSDLAVRMASVMGRSPAGAAAFTVELPTPRGPVPMTVVPAASAGPWNLVFRPTWQPAGLPEERVRPRMTL